MTWLRNALGAAVEIVALVYSTVTWLAQLADQGLYPYKGVLLPSGRTVSGVAFCGPGNHPEGLRLSHSAQVKHSPLPRGQNDWSSLSSRTFGFRLTRLVIWITIARLIW